MKRHDETPTASALLASLLFPAALLADTINFAGNTSGAPTFNRPTESGARSFFSVPFVAYELNVSASGAFTFNLNAANPANYDTFLHLFVDAFNPADRSDPAVNFLAANDDANGSTTNSSLTNFTLSSGTTYFLVVDGFSAAEAGAFSASISGPGTINGVPEHSSTLPLLGVSGLLLVGTHRRFR